MYIQLAVYNFKHLIYFRKGTAIEWRYTQDGEYVRVSLRTGRIIPIPVSSQETVDYKTPDMYVEELKDTTESDVKELTFEVCTTCNLITLCQ